MSLLRPFTRGLRVLTNRKIADQDLTDETQHYLEQAAAALLQQGVTPEEAQRAARMEIESAREQVRESGWENLISSSFADVRHTVRGLRKSLGFTTVCVFTLALGIGACTAIFSTVNPILFEPLPYPHASRIVMIWDIFQGARSDVTFHSYRELAARSHSFEAMAVVKPWQPSMTTSGHPERFEGQKVSADYFRALGVLPTRGKDFQAADDRFQGPRQVIVSDKLWRRFVADSLVAGDQIKLDDNLYTVVGVMPEGFENVLDPSAEIWSPLQYDASDISNLDGKEWGHHLQMLGRLRVGIDKEQARRELDSIAMHPTPEFPRVKWASLEYGLMVNPLQGEITRGVKPALLAILSAVGLVLLIACVNVTNLLLARGVQRRGEFAMRAALGAGRSRLIRQLVTESLVLATFAGLVGLGVAEIGVRVLVALSPPGLPRLGAIAVDGNVFVFAFVVTTLIGLIVGLIPALHGSRGDFVAGIQESSRRTMGGHQFTRRTLVVSEVALALMLLVAAGLLLRSLQNLFAVAPGFDSSRILTMRVQEPDQHFFARALEAVEQVPGVSAAGLTSLLPLSGEQDGSFGANFENGGSYDVFRYVVTSGYFETMGTTLRRGRWLGKQDGVDAPPAVLISESLARSRFSGQNPIGRRLHVGPLNRPWYVIVGVVGDVKQTSLAETQPDAVYITPQQSWFDDAEMSLVVRTRERSTALIPAIKNAVWSVDKDQPIVRVATMDSLLAASESQRRFTLIIFEAFAIVALVLAATGIYGVLSGSVIERTREIGVRSALGASQGDILALIVRQGFTLSGVGIVIGLAGAVISSRGMVTLLFGVTRLDPITYAAVIGALLTVASIASLVPAWRASQVDPSITLRADN